MENASKALIMAGAILIALIIVSLGLLIFKNMSNTVESGTSMTEQQIAQVNNKIMPYVGENISGSQVNALIQLVYSMNMSDETFNISITYQGSPFLDSTGYLRTDGMRKVETGKMYKVQQEYGPGGYIQKVNISK